MHLIDLLLALGNVVSNAAVPPKIIGASSGRLTPTKPDVGNHGAGVATIVRLARLQIAGKT